MQFTPRVLDISHYDVVGGSGPALAGFQQAAEAGIWGIIHKATEGAGMTDKFYAARRGPAEAAQLLYGGYHFMRPGDVGAQVTHFLDVAQPDNHTLLALDHEDPKVPLSSAKQFMDLVFAQVGRYPILYSGFLIKQQLEHATDSYWGSKKLWLSHYSANPTWPSAWAAPWLIQFTGDGIGPGPHSMPGVTLPGGGGLDINSYSGTADQLTAEWAS